MSKECTHPMILSNMCAVCGMILKEDYDTKTFSSLTMSGGTVLKVSTNEALSIQQNKTAFLQQSRRLALVLDIDNTLVHATYAKGRAPVAAARQHAHDKDIYHLPLEETAPDGTRRHLVIKKRPHLDAFLKQMHASYQMTIYTAGTKRYAEAVTRVIDPQGIYIGSRIVARSEDGVSGAHDKSLEKIFLKDSSMAVILDDREDVWRGPQSEQLIVVRPYEYFYPGNAASVTVQACSEMGYVNNAPGTVVNNPGTDPTSPPTAETQTLVPVITLHQPKPGVALGMAARTSAQYTEADDQLLRCLDLLTSLHTHYYARVDKHVASGNPSALASSAVTVAELLRHHRTLILQGCVIAVASDPKMPQHLKHEFTHRMRHLARAMGATVVFDLHPKTTHVIALSEHCSLAKDALTNRAQDVWVLHVDWLHHCRWALAKAEETTFMLRPPPSGTPLPQPKYDTPSASNAAVSGVCHADGQGQEHDVNGNGITSRRKRGLGETVSTSTTTPDGQGKPTSDRASPDFGSFGVPGALSGGSEVAHSTVKDNDDVSSDRARKRVKIYFNNESTAQQKKEDAVLEEVARSARMQRLSEQRRRQQMLQSKKQDETEDSNNSDVGEDSDLEEGVDFQRDAGMKCCTGVGDEDEENVPSGFSGKKKKKNIVMFAQDDEEAEDERDMDYEDNVDRSERVIYSIGRFQDTAVEEDADGYAMRFDRNAQEEDMIGDEEDEEEEEDDEEEMALVQMLRSRVAQQQQQQPLVQQHSQSDSESESFSTLSHFGLRSVANSSVALSGMDTYPSSIPGSPQSLTALTEKTLASIAPGPMVDMDEEEES